MSLKLFLISLGLPITECREEEGPGLLELPTEQASSELEYRKLANNSEYPDIVTKQASSKLKITEKICRELAKDIVQAMVRGDQAKTINSHSPTLRRTVKEVLHKHEIVFKNMDEKLQLTSDESGGRQTFECVANEIFADGKCNWGRLVIVYAFAARLAQYYTQTDFRNREELCNFISEYTGDYVVHKLATWVNSEGGWDNFEKYFEKNSMEKSMWNGMVVTFAFSIGIFAARYFSSH